ncbi:SCO family protein [Tahibacter harae]|uniref:SCO family protein n=1 Tax=Tahibacter harae TaxID=2963937 RepID=A0ABT1QLF2_9GAMM|nr:SCO family protein [Tahibacter harae]MCQ4163252.1 SCO family protein [Tahibacter harae]
MRHCSLVTLLLTIAMGAAAPPPAAAQAGEAVALDPAARTAGEAVRDSASPAPAQAADAETHEHEHPAPASGAGAASHEDEPGAPASAPAAHGPEHIHHAPATPPPPGELTAARIPDVPVLTQAGEPRHFYRDLVQGRLVAINFIFTRCTAVCPLLGARFSQLQKMLGEDMARVGLISVSIDPANDTPQRLAQWSQGLGAQPGWTLVTGERADLDELLRSLGASAADPASHVPIALIVDERRQPARWQRLDGLADAAVLARALRDRLQPESGE